MDSLLDELAASGVLHVALRKETFREIALGAWSAKHRTSLLGFAEGATTLLVPLLLGAGVFITLGPIQLLAVLSGAFAAAIVRDIVFQMLGSRVGLLVSALTAFGYIYFRREALVNTGLHTLQLRSVDLEQLIVLSVFAGLVWNLILFASKSLTLFLTSRKAADIGRDFAREICASELLEVLHLMLQPRAALRRPTRQRVVDALGSATSAAAELNGSLDGDLDPDALVMVAAHFGRFSAFLRDLQIAVSTSSITGWEQAVKLIEHDLKALTVMNYGELHQGQPYFGDNPSRLVSLVRRVSSLAVALLPLGVLLALPILQIPLPANFYGPLVAGFAVYGAVSVLLVLDPSFRERSEAAKSALSLISGAATVGRGDQRLE